MHPFENLPVAPLGADEQQASGGAGIVSAVQSLLDLLGFGDGPERQTDCLRG